MEKLTFEKFFGHLHTIITHRKWVRHFCNLAGIRWRGIKHDLSKYSPIEFLESARYWTGTGSPIVEIKKANGISYAWLHHKGHNSHHYEYWMDNFDDGGKARIMPQDDFVELVCDYLGAAHAYQGDNFTYASELAWWKKRRQKCAMNELNKRMLDIIFTTFHDMEMQDETFGIYDEKNVDRLIKSGFIQQIYNKVIYE